MMKTVKIKKETWRELMHLKIDLGINNIDGAIQHLLKAYQTEKSGEMKNECA